MPTAHLVHGYIGVGKTTLARRLESECRAVRFTHDEWMARLYGRDPAAETFAERSARLSSLLRTLWVRCLELGVSVVLDLNFWSRAERDEARRLTTSQGADFKLYSLKCADEVAWARVEKRNAESEGLFIARATFEALKVRFEPLAPDEERIEILTPEEQAHG